MQLTEQVTIQKIPAEFWSGTSFSLIHADSRFAHLFLAAKEVVINWQESWVYFLQ